ncbi:MAG: rhamnogalacturonan acetylesterase [Lachnospiraceae bacterium]|nr:rhamnogalacturonan acetylesterase [Lachnospiraceae bacterium]
MKKHIFLAGDSTVQSFKAEEMPYFTGWGQVLIEVLGTGTLSEVVYPEKDFPQAAVYENDDVVIHNYAMAGRSSKTFLEEGRFAPMLSKMQKGDFLFLQFGHNDANKEKPERYLTPEDYQKKLMEMISPAREKGVKCALVSPIAMRDFNEEGRCKISFPEYRQAMKELAEREKLHFLDLGKATAELCTGLGAEECKKLFLWVEDREDNAHLQRRGALEFATLLARLIYREIPELGEIVRGK